MSALVRIDRVVGVVLRAIPVACLVALFFILFGNVVSRTFQIWTTAWFDEIVESLFAVMVFVGAAALWRENEHFRVDWLEGILGPRSGSLLRLVSIGLSMVFLFVMAWKGYDLASRSRAVTPILGVPTAYIYAVIPISAALMLVYSVRDLIVAVRAIVLSPTNT
ncbi:TRAP transporter small permease [Acuticoccus sp. I52.16.1]|uniref:TRAP transporter small permease n=1 Tax=Acuticoccus sp. I52.16.1 TaxID=2928472 RepID=UPI001FD4C84E|nr:TRAP transporter small permease [Acuticoccus sp. I52.16.1]UOM35642.1 TRAP transporter small permease [Acuticoccus sp. I52.16.1]